MDLETLGYFIFMDEQEAAEKKAKHYNDNEETESDLDRSEDHT